MIHFPKTAPDIEKTLSVTACIDYKYKITEFAAVNFPLKYLLCDHL